MMGGVTFMVNGKMCIGVLNDDIMVRMDSEGYEAALRRKGCRAMDFTGKPMRGFVYVGPEGTASKRALAYWIGLAMDFNQRAKVSRRKM